MKKLIALLLALAMIACLFVGCGGTDEPETPDTPDTPDVTDAPVAEKKTIGIFVKDNTNPFWRYVVNGAMKAGEDLGVEVIEYTPAEGQNVEQQVSLVQDAIQAKVDAIAFVAIDAEALTDSCKQAMEAGITVVPFNSRMDDLGCKTFVGIDNYTAMTLLMEALYEKLGGEGKVVILEGHLGGYANNERMRAINDFIASHPSLEVVFDQSADAQRELAMTVMENCLQTCDEIDAVICHNDNVAMGAYQAILAAGRVGEMIITGFDAQVEALESMVEDNPPKIDMTIDQSPFGQGYYAIEACVKILNGEAVEEHIVTGGTIVTPENAQAILDEFYSA